MAEAESALTTRQRFAPGTPLREAIERIIQQGTGALIVVGSGRDVDAVCSGGFSLAGATFTPQRMAELAKTDGAVVLDGDASHILKANVHLIPDPSIPTDETGTRHRTAERVARQTGRPVVSISENRRVATVFTAVGRYELQNPHAVLDLANQTMHSLERFRRRLADAEADLTAAEAADLATVRDVVVTLQRVELVRRIGTDLERLAVEMGEEGGLIRLQVGDLIAGVDTTALAVYADYVLADTDPGELFANLGSVPTPALSDPQRVASALSMGSLDRSVRTAGRRLLSRIPRLPESVVDSLIGHFTDFSTMLHAPVAELDQVEGVGSARARHLRRYFDRLLDAAHPVDEP